MKFGKHILDRQKPRVVFTWFPRKLYTQQWAWLEKVWYDPDIDSYSEYWEREIDDDFKSWYKDYTTCMATQYRITAPSNEEVCRIAWNAAMKLKSRITFTDN